MKMVLVKGVRDLKKWNEQDEIRVWIDDGTC